MKKRLVPVIAVGSLIVGVMLGVLLAPWIAPTASAQINQAHFQVERQTGFMFIRDLKTQTCFLAVDGGGIVPAICGF
jgi:hypothetical protein